MQIKCPSCGKKFRSEADLTGKTVKCGACDEKFTVTDDEQVSPEGRRFYPGEKKSDFLDRLSGPGGSALPPEQARPNFQPASYATVAAQAQPHTDVAVGGSPLKRVAIVAGICVFLVFLYIIIVGTSDDGFLRTTPMEKRIGLAGFGVFLLTMIGALSRQRGRGKGALIGAVAGLPLLIAVGSMPPPRDVVETIEIAEEGVAPVELDENVDMPLPDKIGLPFIARAIQRANDRGYDTDSVYSFYFSGVRPKQRLQVRDFLQKVAKSNEPPIMTERDGVRGLYVYVVMGGTAPFSELLDACDRLGLVTDHNESMKLAEVEFNEESFRRPDSSKVTDVNHPAFYELNLSELRSIDDERVISALKRIAEVEPKRNRAEVNARLIELGRTRDVEMLNAVAAAMIVWSEDVDAAGAALMNGLEQVRIHLPSADVPYDVARFIALRQYAPGYPELMALWEVDPFVIEPLFLRLGQPGEDLLLPYLEGESATHKLAAIGALTMVGTEKSLAPLRELREGANRELLRTIDRTIDSITKRVDE